MGMGLRKAENILKDRLKINSLNHLGFEKELTIMRSLNALLTYIEKNIGNIQTYKNSSFYSQNNHFVIDSTSQRALELVRPHFFENKNVTLLNNSGYLCHSDWVKNSKIMDSITA